jgi:zinc-binding alcohol dehydrogenase family protein
MKAIGFFEFGGPEVLRFVEVARPAPRPRDVVVRVMAVSVNPVDAKVRRGLRGGAGKAAGVPTVIGWDAAGIVEEVGGEARRFQAGDEVYLSGDITRPGSYAEYVACDERIVGRKPKTLSFEQAAAIPLTAITAWEAFLENMGAPEGGGAGRTALVLGGAGGVGSIAIQIAKWVCGLRVIATASRRESAAFCQTMGADGVIDHSKDLASQLPSVDVSGFDYILSCADTNDFAPLAGVLNFMGKICCILPVPSADLSALFGKRGSVHFELMFARPTLGAEPERQGVLLDRVAELLDQRVLVPTVTKVLDWTEFRTAHAAIDSGHTVGKIVMRVAS